MDAITDVALVVGAGGPLVSCAAGARRRGWLVPVMAGCVMAAFLVAFVIAGGEYQPVNVGDWFAALGIAVGAPLVATAVPYRVARALAANGVAVALASVGLLACAYLGLFVALLFLGALTGSIS